MSQELTFGVIVGNRGVFPSHLILDGREKMLNVLHSNGIKSVALDTEHTKNGGVSTLDEAIACSDLFKKHRQEIDGILVTLPNFGDEKSVSDAIRYSGLNVPVLVHAFDDDKSKMTAANRRDSFCGKLSLCNNLNQYGIPFSLTKFHTIDPSDEAFAEDLNNFSMVCRVFKGLRNIRVGVLGARPTNFNTVRFSEKLLERHSITVDTLDLSEAFGRTQVIKSDDPELNAKIEEIRSYAVIDNVPDEALIRMAKLGVVVDRWMVSNHLTLTAIQCWTAMEKYYGITPCTLMSILSDKLLPSACETDVMGVLSMYALTLASQQPSSILDWNNNYGTDRLKTVLFHCSNLPASFFEERPEIVYSEIFAGDVGQENAYGTMSGRIKPEPFTYCRLSSDELAGKISVYLGEGIFTNDELSTFGGYGVAEVPRLQELMRYICLNSFEHHVATNLAKVADPLEEVFTRYFNWNVYRHS